MKRRKCEVIPVSVYEGTPPVEFEDNTHKYFKGPKGHYRKATRRTCCVCAKTATFVCIFKYPRHNRVERFCREHAQKFASEELPGPEQEIESRVEKSVII